MKISIKLRLFSDRLFERRHEGREGGGGLYIGGLMGREGLGCGQVGWGQECGWGGGGWQ